MWGFIQNLPLLCTDLLEGERLCHKSQSVTAQSVVSRSQPINVFARTVEQCWKRSHHHQASMERNLHPKVIRIHSKHLPTPNSHNRHLPMPNNSNSCHPMLNRHNNRYHRMHNNSKIRSPKRSALLAFFSCYVTSAGEDMPAIDPNASAVAVVDALCCWSSYSSV